MFQKITLVSFFLSFVASFCQAGGGLSSKIKSLDRDEQRSSYLSLVEKKPEEARHLALNKDKEGLLRLAREKILQAEKLVVKGITEGKYGFDCNPSELIREYELKNVYAIGKVIQGASESLYGFKRYSSEENLEKLIQYADDGWQKAQEAVRSALGEGLNGFDKNPARLESLEKIWEKKDIGDLMKNWKTY